MTSPPLSQQRAHEPDAGSAGSRWSSLYRIGGAAALFGVALIPIQLVVYIVWGQPDTALGWFTLFQHNKLAGLLAIELLFVINTAVGIATILALYVVLRRVNESLMAIALALGLVEAVTLILARPVFEMLYLSERYAAATTDAQRSLFLAAGETVWATFNGTAFHVSYNIFSIYVLMVAVVMLRGNIFGRTTAYAGILAAIFNWGLYVPGVGIFFAILSIVPLAIWNVLIARRLYQLGRASRKVSRE